MANSTISLNLPFDEGGYVKAFKYPAGEWQVRLTPEFLRDLQPETNVTVTARIKSADDFMQLLLLGSALDGLEKVERTSLFLPYLPYSRADRRFTEGDCEGLHVFMEALRHTYEHTFTYDIHNESTIHNSVWLSNISPEGEMRAALAAFAGDDDVTVLLPDKGAADRYGGYMNASRPRGATRVMHASKIRDPKSGELKGFDVPNISGKVLIVDDICDGGGTFIGIAKELYYHNRENFDALKLGLHVSHGIYSKGLWELKKYFSFLSTTNSFCGEEFARENNIMYQKLALPKAMIQ